MPALAVVTTDETPLSPARAELARLNKAVAAVREAVEEANGPIERLRATFETSQQAEAKLSARRVIDAAA